VVGPIQPFTDFEWTVYGDIVVASAVADALTKEKFSGVQFAETQFYTTTETPFGRDSLEMRINGWGGMAPVDSGIRVVEQCPYCKDTVFSGYTRPSRLFNIEAWDGSDLFLIWPLPRYVMVTGRVRDFLLHAKFTGVRLRGLEELPEVVAGTLTPGNLRDWLDEERIRVIDGF
jgi:hypothetical protein